MLWCVEVLDHEESFETAEPVFTFIKVAKNEKELLIQLEDHYNSTETVRLAPDIVKLLGIDYIEDKVLASKPDVGETIRYTVINDVDTFFADGFDIITEDSRDNRMEDADVDDVIVVPSENKLWLIKETIGEDFVVKTLISGKDETRVLLRLADHFNADKAVKVEDGVARVYGVDYVEDDAGVMPFITSNPESYKTLTYQPIDPEVFFDVKTYNLSKNYSMEEILETVQEGWLKGEFPISGDDDDIEDDNEEYEEEEE